MKKVQKHTKEFEVGDVIVDTITHRKGKIYLHPIWFIENYPTMIDSTYCINWIDIGYDLDVEYREEVTLKRLINFKCEKVEYDTF